MLLTCDGDVIYAAHSRAFRWSSSLTCPRSNVKLKHNLINLPTQALHRDGTESPAHMARVDLTKWRNTIRKQHFIGTRTCLCSGKHVCLFYLVRAALTARFLAVASFAYAASCFSTWLWEPSWCRSAATGSARACMIFRRRSAVCALDG